MNTSVIFRHHFMLEYFIQGKNGSDKAKYVLQTRTSVLRHLLFSHYHWIYCTGIVSWWNNDKKKMAGCPIIVHKLHIPDPCNQSKWCQIVFTRTSSKSDCWFYVASIMAGHLVLVGKVLTPSLTPGHMSLKSLVGQLSHRWTELFWLTGDWWAKAIKVTIHKISKGRIRSQC